MKVLSRDIVCGPFRAALLLAVLWAVVPALPAQGPGPATILEAFYLALGRGDAQAAAALVLPGDRNRLGISAFVPLLYGLSGSNAGLDTQTVFTTVLSREAADGNSLYWFEPAATAKVALRSPGGSSFVFTLRSLDGQWFVDLSDRAMEELGTQLTSGTDPATLVKSGRRSPGDQAMAFLKAMAAGEPSRANRYMSRDGRRLFALMSIFAAQNSAAGPQDVQILQEQVAGERANVELLWGPDTRLMIYLQLEEGEWLVSPGISR